MSRIIKALNRVMAVDRVPADYYVESQPSCPWCEGKSEWGEGANSIKHRQHCAWVELVAAWEEENLKR